MKVVRMKHKTYNDGLRAAASIALGYIGSAARDRKLKGVKLSDVNPDAAQCIRDEERGEDIAAARISQLILEAQENPELE